MTTRSVRILLWVLAATLLVAAGPGDAQEAPPDSSWAGPAPTLDRLKAGYEAMEAGSFEAALEHYRGALGSAATPELRFQAEIGVGAAATALGRGDEAREAYLDALRIKPGNPAVLLALGELAKAEGMLDEAAARFAEAAVADPPLIEALTQLGVVYELQERHAEAAEACGRAVARAPQDVEALLCAGVSLYHLGGYAEAGGYFAAAVEQDPNNARGRYGLGLAKLYLGDLDGAQAEQQALEGLDPALAQDLGERIAAER